MPKKKAPLALVPATLRQAIQQKAVPIPSAVHESLYAFEQAIGGRQAIIEALSAGDSSEEVAQVLTILADPRCDRWSLARVCREGKITPGQLMHALEVAALARGRVLALAEAARQVPAITREVLSEAVPHEIPCESCNGTGQQVKAPTQRDPSPKPYTCPSCMGVGKLRRSGDFDRQKLALELTQLLPKANGVQVQTNVQVNTPAQAGLGSLAQLHQAVGEVLWGDPKPAAVVEATVVQEPGD